MSLEQRIFAELAWRIGRENAITAPELAAKLGESCEREVRRIIATQGPAWAKQLGAMLISTSGQGGGFYLANEAEQIQRKHAQIVREHLQAGDRRTKFEQLMRTAGFGGLIPLGQKEGAAST